MSLAEKCSTLVSWRSISVSHTRIPSRVPSKSSRWEVKCCRTDPVYTFTDGARADHLTQTPVLTLRRRTMDAALLCRMSHLRFPSWTVSFSLPAASVRFSRASRRYCLFSSSS